MGYPYRLLGTFLAFMASSAFAQSSPGLAPDLSSADTAWLLTASAFVLFMTPGLAFFYGGMVKPKHMISTMTQSFICMGLMSLVWIVAGFSLAFGDSLGGLVGQPLQYFMLKGVDLNAHKDLAPTIPFLLYAFFQMKFAVITPALITGSFAERMNFKGFMLFAMLFCLLIYAPIAHWTWHPEGFLKSWGVLDFAGGTVVHLTAGCAALAGALYLGPRRRQRDMTHGHVPYVLLGTGMLWFGWFGFNAGSALGANGAAVTALATTHTAAAAAAISWMLYDMFSGHKPNATGICMGAIVGLVAITPAAAYVSITHSFLIGSIAAILSHLIVDMTKHSALDDTLDVFACHGIGGFVGMILTGVFAKDLGLIYGPREMFLNHVFASVVVASFSFFGSYALFKLVDSIIPLRVCPVEEELGLDLCQHGEATAWEESDEPLEENLSNETLPHS